MKYVHVEMRVRIQIDDNLEQRLQGQPALDKICAVCGVSYGSHHPLPPDKHEFRENPVQDYDELQNQAYRELDKQIADKLGIPLEDLEVTGIEP